MVKKSFAKINYNLKIYEKRHDGYHMMQSYMQKVSLYDELFFDFSGDGIQVEVEGRPDLQDEKNIVYQAAKLFFDALGIDPTVKIKLKKNIFMAAGLAGGSSNAGCTLLALNEKYQTLSFDVLLELAAELGSDVPFFLYDEDLMFVDGRGIDCKTEKSLLQKPMLLINPGVEVSTAKIYQRLNRSSKIKEKDSYFAIQSWSDASAVMKQGNDMQSCAEAFCPEIAKLQQLVKETEGCFYTQMSGSGATLWAIYDHEEDALKAGEKIKSEGNVIFTWTGTSSCFKRL